MLPGPRNVYRLVGWPLIAAGTYLVVRSWAAARQVDLEYPDRLVTTGPYSVSRNPMYVGWALLHLGAGVAGGSGYIVAALPAAAVWVHRNVLREERELGEDFGHEFGRYRAAVPRYLAGWRSSRTQSNPDPWQVFSSSTLPPTGAIGETEPANSGARRRGTGH